MLSCYEILPAYWVGCVCMNFILPSFTWFHYYIDTFLAAWLLVMCTFAWTDLLFDLNLLVLSCHRFSSSSDFFLFFCFPHTHTGKKGRQSAIFLIANHFPNSQGVYVCVCAGWTNIVFRFRFLDTHSWMSAAGLANKWQIEEEKRKEGKLFDWQKLS